jgi:ribosomal protein L24E
MHLDDGTGTLCTDNVCAVLRFLSEKTEIAAIMIYGMGG